VILVFESIGNTRFLHRSWWIIIPLLARVLYGTLHAWAICLKPCSPHFKTPVLLISYDFHTPSVQFSDACDCVGIFADLE